MDFCVTVCVFLTVVVAVAPAGSQPLNGGMQPRSNCAEQPLEQREEIANVVLSGYVGKIMRKPRTLQYSCEVHIVRVLKGEETIHNGISPPMDTVNNQVMVSGFGDPTICDNAAHVGDVRILLLGQDDEGHLKLNSSLVRITLDNLDKAQAAVYDVPYVTREPIEEGPCATILCAYGSVCREISNAEAECFCAEECPDIFSPVCGTDGVTYNNDCYLKSSSCRLRARITVKSSGPCDSSTLCKDKECPFGSECMITPDGAFAKCVCSQECEEAHYDPVCGSDGVDYANECEMKRVGCLQRQQLKVIYHGPCNPCSAASFDQNAACQLDRNRRPIASCVLRCEESPSNPVCASDSQMYESECLMRRVACQSRIELFVHEEQNCKPETSPCHNFDCEYGKCILDLEGSPTCVCISSCPEIYVPVCGSDGNTYYSSCHLQREQCLKNRAIQVVSKGPCLNQTEGVCSTIRCGYGAMCVLLNGSPTCSCDMMCSHEDKPVCGTDKMTYGNACLLKQAACEQQKEIEVELEGLCNGCDFFNCEFGAICEMVATGPRCVCPEECVNFDSSVCGSDDVTYPNECEMNVQACRRQEVITIVSQGECRECEGVKCEYGSVCNRGQCSCPTCANILQRVCGTNQVTYQSVCHLQAEMCNQRIRVAVAFNGPCEDSGEMSGSGDGNDTKVDQEGGDGDNSVCDEAMCQYGGTCEFMTNGNSYCSCIMNCPATRLPVCGSNQVTYGSECLLREASCEQQKPIFVESRGSCEDVEMEPCDGDTPLLVPNTQEEYTCSEHGEECPSGSYCHIHPLRRFAVCCPEQTSPPGCEDTMYGCCPDGTTAAQGFKEAGCPSHCECHELGSYSPVCNPSNKQCPCKPGVGGKKCDRCEPGFWDFRGIQNGNIGCRPCGCARGGSARDDCEQMMGKCMCKGKAMGIKCDVCPKGMTLMATGCQEDAIRHNAGSNLCEQLRCRYHASCKFMAGLATCVCPSNCTTIFDPVCGTDGQTYGNECQMKVFACRLQRDIQLYARGICNSVVVPPMTISQECLDSEFGCCDDEETPKTNTEGKGCPLLPVMTTSQILSSVSPTSEISSKSDPSAPSSVTDASSGSLLEEVTSSDLVDVTTVDSSMLEATTLSAPPVDDMSHSTPQKDGTTLPSPPPETSFALPTKPGVDLITILTDSEDITSESNNVMTTKSSAGSEPSLTTAQMPISAAETSVPNIVTSAPLSKTGKPVSEASEPVSSTVRVLETTLPDSDPSSAVLQTSLPSTQTPSKTSSVASSMSSSLDSTKNPSQDPSTPPPNPITTQSSPEPTVAKTTPVEITPLLLTQMLSLSTQFQANPTEPNTVFPSTTTQAIPELATQAPQTTEPAPVCQTNPCLHGGSCLEKEASPRGYVCLCPVGRGGPVCEEVVSFESPSLSEHSYIVFPTNPASSARVDITLEFQVDGQPEGLLLFSGQYYVLSSNDISLAIVSGTVELRYNAGQNGDIIIRSTVIIQPLHWYTVRVIRNRREGSLSVDSEIPVKGASSAAKTLGADLFIGDVPDHKQEVYKLAGTTVGFTGCIGYLEVNNKVLNVYHPGGDILYGANVGECGNDPCLVQPCRNNATCTPTDAEQFECECKDGFVGPLCGDVFVDPCEGNMCHSGSTCSPLPEGGYRCDCQLGWEGDMCDTEIKPEPFIPGFDGNSFLKLPGLKAPRHITVVVEFLATEPNGMIFYNGQSTDGNGDFISLNLIDGFLEFRYNLGSGTAEIRSPKRITLNEWHIAKASRMNMDGTLTLDGEVVAKGRSTGGAKQLNLKLSLYIGGTDNYSQLSRKAGITDGFVGAIKTLTVDQLTVEDLIAASLGQANIQRFVAHPCVARPCSETYECIPEGDTYSCDCPAGTEEINQVCDVIATSTDSADDGRKELDINAPVFFDGQNYYSYPNIATQQRQAQRTNMIRIQFRTSQQSGLMLYNSIHSPTGDFAAVAIVDSRVEFAYNLGAGVKRIASTIAVSDNQWHTVIISRTQRDSSIQVDDEAPSLGASKQFASFLNTDGIMWIGGYSRLQANVPPEYRTSFQGCIANVELQENSLHLYNNALGEQPSSFCDDPEA